MSSTENRHCLGETIEKSAELLAERRLFCQSMHAMRKEAKGNFLDSVMKTLQNPWVAAPLAGAAGGAAVGGLAELRHKDPKRRNYIGGMLTGAGLGAGAGLGGKLLHHGMSTFNTADTTPEADTPIPTPKRLSRDEIEAKLSPQTVAEALATIRENESLLPDSGDAARVGTIAAAGESLAGATRLLQNRSGRMTNDVRDLRTGLSLDADNYTDRQVLQVADLNEVGTRTPAPRTMMDRFLGRTSDPLAHTIARAERFGDIAIIPGADGATPQRITSPEIRAMIDRGRVANAATAVPRTPKRWLRGGNIARLAAYIGLPGVLRYIKTQALKADNDATYNEILRLWGREQQRLGGVDPSDEWVLDMINKEIKKQGR